MISFGEETEQLFLAIEIMVKCSHALNWSLQQNE